MQKGVLFLNQIDRMFLIGASGSIIGLEVFPQLGVIIGALFFLLVGGYASQLYVFQQITDVEEETKKGRKDTDSEEETKEKQEEENVR